MDPITISGIFGIGGKLIDKLFPNPEDKAKAQLELLRLQQSGEGGGPRRTNAVLGRAARGASSLAPLPAPTARPAPLTRGSRQQTPGSTRRQAPFGQTPHLDGWRSQDTQLAQSGQDWRGPDDPRDREGPVTRRRWLALPVLCQR